MSKFPTKEELNEMYETGMAVFTKLFELKSVDLKAKLKEICGDKVPKHMFEDRAQVNKTTMNDQPQRIEIYFYDGIFIDVLGIRYSPEHGVPRDIVKFDKFFTL